MAWTAAASPEARASGLPAAMAMAMARPVVTYSPVRCWWKSQADSRAVALAATPKTTTTATRVLRKIRDMAGQSPLSADTVSRATSSPPAAVDK